MAKQKTTEKVVVTTEDVDTVAEGVKNEATKTKRNEVTVSYRGLTRVYSREIHGDDFEKLAQSFAQKFDGTVA